MTMTEDELLAGITQALELTGWTWTHIIRSDGHTMGASGLPDIIAVHPFRDVVLMWELKDMRRQPTAEQVAWIIGARGKRVDARVIRPSDYDEALDLIVHPERG